MINQTKFSKWLLLGMMLFALGISSCGSGGSDDNTDSDFLGAARVSLSISPGKVDTGDRIQVNIEMSDIHPDGILLKVKYTTALRFVPESAKFIANNKNNATSPLFDLDNDDDEHFLVFVVRQNSFGTPKQGRLNFELQGVEETERAAIEIDPDVDNPLIANADEFNIEEPEFTAEDNSSVEVQP
jgi:hypothetical protein